MATEKRILILAKKLSDQFLADYNSWLEECESYRLQGYRPEWCEHGVRMWVDWDCACGACEEGFTMADGVFRRQEALAAAKRRIEAQKELVKASALFDRCGITFDFDAFAAEYNRLGKV